MESIKCGVAIDDKTLYDMASLFRRLIIIGQLRQVELQTLYDYELCAVPASIIDEYGCLRTGTKSTLVSKLKVDDLQPDAPDIVIVDGQQLLYHIVWPCAGSASGLANSMKDILGQYQPPEVLVIFDRYDDRSARDHERIRRAGEGAVNYNITTSSKLPCCDAIIKSKANKKALVKVLSTFKLGNAVTMVGREKSMYSYDEADITTISYLLEDVKNGKNIVRMINDDTDVFVLLMFWVWRLQMTARVQLDRWCGLSSIPMKVFRSLVRNPSNCSVCMHYQAAILCPIHLVMAK